ncbi:MAG: hypothetical protein KatS3mg112_0503 [Thermogutta sp.]|nr:MAG: hypothetical protein KatS3mg112_0503 [Thermogutta sp.]
MVLDWHHLLYDLNRVRCNVKKLAKPNCALVRSYF